VTSGARPPLSLFEHYVAQCAIAHQRAVTAAKAGRETSDATVALIERMHHLAEIVKTRGADEVFKHPARPFDRHEIRRLFPDEVVVGQAPPRDG
jgi:hypothetical protein